MYIGDLHIHSRYSRATSKELTPEHLDLWAGKKGINIVGTGDFTHPAWRAELAEKLEPAEPGLYMLKKEYSLQRPSILGQSSPRFVISGEISSFYKKNGRPGIGLSRSFGHNTGGMPGCHLCSGPHLDPAFFTVRGIFRF